MQKMKDRNDYPALEQAFKRIDTSAGVRETSLTTADGNTWNFRVKFPEKVAGQKPPLVMGLHWAGPEGSYKEYASCLAEPGFESLGSIVISPEGNQQLWTTEFNKEKVLTILTLAREHWSVDTTRVIVTGYSNGGNGSWYFAEHYPELFSAAIPMASSYEVFGKIQVPLYVIHGKEDELFPLALTQAFIQKTQQAGTKIRLKVVDNLSHFMACAYVNELKKAAEWIFGE